MQPKHRAHFAAAPCTQITLSFARSRTPDMARRVQMAQICGEWACPSQARAATPRGTTNRGNMDQTPHEHPKVDITALLARGQARRRWRWPAALVAAAVLGAGLWLALVHDRGGPKINYVTTAVTRGPLTVHVTATGTVQPTTEVEISSELSGTIRTVNVDYNDRVSVGQVLATLDDTKLRATVANAEAQRAGAAADLLQAQASLREAQSNLDQQTAINGRGIGSEKDLVAMQAAYDRAAAAVQSAEANLKLADANLTLKQADLDDAVLRSPINGIVLGRAAEKGKIVAASLNAPVLFTLAEDLSKMLLQVNIDEADIGQVAVGNTATFTVDAFPGRRFPARITQVRFAPETTDGVVTYTAVLSVENPDGLLRPGMTATATIVVAEVPDTLTVPNAALRYTPPATRGASGRRGGTGLLGLIMPRPSGASVAPVRKAATSVWVQKDGTPVEVPVTPGPTDGTQTAVTSDTLAEGDMVITDQTGAVGR